MHTFKTSTGGVEDGRNWNLRCDEVPAARKRTRRVQIVLVPLPARARPGRAARGASCSGCSATIPDPPVLSSSCEGFWAVGNAPPARIIAGRRPSKSITFTYYIRELIDFTYLSALRHNVVCPRHGQTRLVPE